MTRFMNMDPTIKQDAAEPVCPLENSSMVVNVTAKKTFQMLSHDVKNCIINQINRPSDLKNVCLVSKELHEIAVRYLYYDVRLDLGSLKDNLMPAFMSPRNVGLKHIRKIRLYLANVPERCYQEQQATFATRMLLEFLPDDILEEFRCGFTET